MTSTADKLLEALAKTELFDDSLTPEEHEARWTERLAADFELEPEIALAIVKWYARVADGTARWLEENVISREECS